MSDRISIIYRSLLILAFLFTGIPAATAGMPRGDTEDQIIQDRIIRETPDKLLWSLPDGNQVWLTKNPKKTVVLLTSLLELWYETGGEAVARCHGNLNVPEKAMALPQVGTFNNPNAEKIIALEPDLVISSNLPAFRRLIPLLQENNIAYAYFNYINFYDYSRILTLFSKLNNTEGRVNKALADMGERIRTENVGDVLVELFVSPIPRGLQATQRLVDRAHGETGHVVRISYLDRFSS